MKSHLLALSTVVGLSFTTPIVTFGMVDAEIAQQWKNLDNLTQDKLSYARHSDKYLSSEQVGMRFENIYCPKDTVVEVNGKYLHANYIGPPENPDLIIAAQAPLKEQIPLFWELIYRDERDIYDLTTASEIGMHKVNLYYPTVINKSAIYGDFTVTLIEQILAETGLLSSDFNVHIYFYKVKYKNQDEKLIRRIHYKDWLDRTVGSVKILNKLIDLQTKEGDKAKKRVIHDIAGVGRSGMVVAALLLKEKIKNGNITRDNLLTLLNEHIFDLRTKRGEMVIHTFSQYELLMSFADHWISELYEQEEEET